MQTKLPIDNGQLIENELDIRGLYQVIWQGKIMIIAITLLFLLVALTYSLLVQQQWCSIAIVDKPSINMLGRYYQQQHLLNSLDKNSAAQAAIPLAESVIDKVYNEFIVQLGAYDTRRAFWLQSSYYKQRQKGDKSADAILLEELITQIVYSAKDGKKSLFDKVSMIAETAVDARQLLHDYIVFVNQRVAERFNEDLAANWQMYSHMLQDQLKQQQALEQQSRERSINNLKQAIAMAEQQNITSNQLTGVPMESVAQSQLFLLGKPILQTWLNALTSSSPQFDAAYQQTRQSLGQLQAGPVLQKNLQVYRYLQTPEEPIQRDSPRRLFLLLLWGSVGLVVGVVIVSGRRVARQPQ